MSKKIDSVIQSYLDNREISGGAMIVRKGGQIVYQNKWGWADIAAQTPIDDTAIFRMMSMTKPVTAVGILMLMEKGLLRLDDPISRFLPQFSNMQVSCDKRYVYKPGMNMAFMLLKLPFFRMERVKTEPASREITIRDLLSHCSGLEQGIVGFMAMAKDKQKVSTLSQQMDKFSRWVLGFQPGTDTGYSPRAGFDVLTRIIEIVSGMDADTYFRKEIFEPLGMKDSFFWPDDMQKKRIVKAYKRKKDDLLDVTGTKDDMYGILACEEGYIAGCGGLFSTLSDYDHFVQMLNNGGSYNGIQFLTQETVQLMHTEAPEKHMEPDPGQVWGLGVKIRQDPVKGNLPVTTGTYGWSGAFGTHFFISPEDDLSCVWMTNRTDLGGSGSYISAKIEELVFSEFGG